MEEQYVPNNGIKVNNIIITYLTYLQHEIFYMFLYSKQKTTVKTSTVECYDSCRTHLKHDTATIHDYKRCKKITFVKQDSNASLQFPLLSTQEQILHAFSLSGLQLTFPQKWDI